MPLNFALSIPPLVYSTTEIACCKVFDYPVFSSIALKYAVRLAGIACLSLSRIRAGPRMQTVGQSGRPNMLRRSYFSRLAGQPGAVVACSCRCCPIADPSAEPPFGSSEGGSDEGSVAVFPPSCLSVQRFPNGVTAGLYPLARRLVAGLTGA